jgi:hypothetical protein
MTSRRDGLRLGLTAVMMGALPWCRAHAQAAASAAQVDLLLVLAVDASGSVNQARFELQRAGYAAAFRDVDVLRAIRSGTVGAIAVAMLQWTGARLQTVVVPWTRVHDDATAEELARLIERAPRQLFSGGTSISGAIDFSLRQFASSPWTGRRRVIDVSGDGANNGGRPPSQARDEAVAQDVVINGLPILAIEPDLDRHYHDEVIGGAGAFLVVAENFEAFAAAVRRKLVLEISAAPGDPAYAGMRTGRLR